MNQSATKIAENSPMFDSLSITSMENRTIRKSIRASNPADPLVVMHIGNDRALNVIPKKFNKEMLDVYNVTLGNFSTLIVASHTQQLMNLTLPYESSTINGMDLHLLIIPFRKNALENCKFEQEDEKSTTPVDTEKKNTNDNERTVPKLDVESEESHTLETEQVPLSIPTRPDPETSEDAINGPKFSKPLPNSA